jgi:hypothetical protein
MTLILTGPPPSWKAQLEAEDLQNVKRGAEFVSLTGVAATRLGNGDWIYLVDTTAANRQVILPRAADEVGHLHTVKRISAGANTCVVSSEGGNLDGSASYSIATQYVAVGFFADGDNWWAI